jgi:hypothetical protein
VETDEPSKAEIGRLKRKLSALMKKAKDVAKDMPVIPAHERPLGHMMHKAKGVPFEPLRSLDEARAYDDAYVIFQGDWGGQIYLTAPIAEVRCSMHDLEGLLKDLDESQWDCNEGDGANIFFERMSGVSGVPGGMGGGRIGRETWIHQNLIDAGLTDYISATLRDEPVPGR